MDQSKANVIFKIVEGQGRATIKDSGEVNTLPEF